MCVLGRCGKEDGQDRLQEFLMYCVIGWGAPFVVVVVGVVLDALEADAVRPGFHPTSCWFFGKWTLLSVALEC